MNNNEAAGTQKQQKQEQGQGLEQEIEQQQQQQRGSPRAAKKETLSWGDDGSASATTTTSMARTGEAGLVGNGLSPSAAALSGGSEKSEREKRREMGLVGRSSSRTQMSDEEEEEGNEDNGEGLGNNGLMGSGEKREDKKLEERGKKGDMDSEGRMQLSGGGDNGEGVGSSRSMSSGKRKANKSLEEKAKREEMGSEGSRRRQGDDESGVVNLGEASQRSPDDPERKKVRKIGGIGSSKKLRRGTSEESPKDGRGLEKSLQFSSGTAFGLPRSTTPLSARQSSEDMSNTHLTMGSAKRNSSLIEDVDDDVGAVTLLSSASSSNFKQKSSNRLKTRFPSDARSASEESKSKEGGSNSNLMDHVRQRMKNQELTPYVVVGNSVGTPLNSNHGKPSAKNVLSPKKPTSLHSSLIIAATEDDEANLLPPKTCGINCETSYRVLFSVSLTLILLAMASIVVGTNTASTINAMTTSEAYCANATDAMVNMTGEVVLSAASQLATTIASTLAVDTSNTISQSIAVSQALFNFLFSFTNSDIYNCSGAQLRTATNIFMLLQASSPIYQYVDAVMLAFDFGYYSDYNICDAAFCVNTHAFVVNDTMVRCPIIIPDDPSNIFDDLEDTSDNCTFFPGYSIDNLEEYQLINTIADIAGQNALLSGGWTDFFVFPNATLNPETDPVAGVAFAFPSAFYGDTFSAMTGVISTKISTVSLALLLITSMNHVLNLYNSQAGYGKVPINDSVGYMTERSPTQSGALLAGYEDSDLIAPTTLIFASDYYESPIIQTTASFLESISPISGPYYDFTRSFIFNMTSQAPCNESSSLDELALCYEIVASPITSSKVFTYPGYELKILTVVVIPVRDVINGTIQKVHQTEEDLRIQREENITHLETLISVFVIVALILILIGIIFAIVIAFVITRPLNKISTAMERMLNFDFAEDDDISPDKRTSRVTDVALAQNTFNSLRKSLEVFSRFVPETVVRNIIKGGKGRNLFVDVKVVTIMFSDIKGFASIAEKFPQTELLDFLAKYLAVMTSTAENLDGVVAEILGDGLLVFWNTPDDVNFHEAKACAAALAQQHAMETIVNKEFRELFDKYGCDKDISIRIGIHTGTVLSGNIGSEIKMKFGCLGDSVNLTSRVAGLCKLYEVGIIITSSTMDGLPAEGKFRTRELDIAQVKGKNKPTPLFELVSMEGTFEDKAPSRKWMSIASRSKPTGGNSTGYFESFKRAAKGNSNKQGITRVIGPELLTECNPMSKEDVQIYENALKAFRMGEFEDAGNILEKMTTKTDGASKYLKSRIENAKKKFGSSIRESSSAMLEPWTGVNRLNEKF